MYKCFAESLIGKDSGSQTVFPGSVIVPVELQFLGGILKAMSWGLKTGVLEGRAGDLCFHKLSRLSWASLVA